MVLIVANRKGENLPTQSCQGFEKVFNVQLIQIIAPLKWATRNDEFK